jgi:hypothetical protein
MGFHWQSITLQHIVRHHHLLYLHIQTPPMAAQKGCQQKSKMVYSEHRPADTTCMKGLRIVHYYTSDTKRGLCNGEEKWRGNRIEEEISRHRIRGFRSDTNMVLFSLRNRSMILPRTNTHTQTQKKSRRNKLANDWTNISGSDFLLFKKNGTLQIEKKRWLLGGRIISSRQQYLRQVLVITARGESQLGL